MLGTANFLWWNFCIHYSLLFIILSIIPLLIMDIWLFLKNWKTRDTSNSGFIASTIDTLTNFLWERESIILIKLYCNRQVANYRLTSPLHLDHHRHRPRHVILYEGESLYWRRKLRFLTDYRFHGRCQGFLPGEHFFKKISKCSQKNFKKYSKN